MAISHDPPSVLIGPGDFHTGPYYIIISGLPERTSWQDVKDFIKSQIPWKLDIYVSIFGKRQDSGWAQKHIIPDALTNLVILIKEFWGSHFSEAERYLPITPVTTRLAPASS
ncbi:hypothetical protein N0V85_002541 [Neurospora sp. IMI 360204]|nr:hypothetical protein N0V85_002541 [Neurospora sp. IMI 360204]